MVDDKWLFAKKLLVPVQVGLGSGEKLLIRVATRACHKKQNQYFIAGEGLNVVLVDIEAQLYVFLYHIQVNLVLDKVCVKPGASL